MGGTIPVYTDFIRGRTKVVTLLRRCGGDVEVFVDYFYDFC